MSDAPLKSRNPAKLQAAKRELLSLLLEKERIESHGSKRVEPRLNRNNTPLSFGQERLWFLDQLDPGNSVYNICRAQRLKGPLDTAALERSLHEIVRHHEILRTIFPAVDGHPVQIVTPILTLGLPLFDLQQVISTSREAETTRIIDEEARYAFNLSSGPLLRVALLRLAREEYVLVITAHQIVCDGWSMGLLFQGIERAYETITNGQPVLLRELSIQYGDYAHWQREWLQGKTLESLLSYWKNQLAGLTLVTELPSDRSRPAIQQFRGKRQYLTTSDNVIRVLREMCGDNISLFVPMLAAFFVLLHRYTDQEDLTVGSPWMNRHHQLEIQHLMGFFINTLVLRTHVSGDFTFRELLKDVRNNFLAAVDHQELPFEKIVEEFQQVRDLSRNPLFQIMFAFQNVALPALSLAALTTEIIDVDTGTSKFDLTLSLVASDGKLRGFFEYNTDLFDHSTIERMVRHFQTLLEGIVGDPDQRIATLPILTKAESRQLLVEWNDTAADYPKDECIHQLFEEQVERTPDAVAVEFEDQQITYAELNRRANQLAHYLISLGIGPEKFVGICVERSIEMVVGLLGILKAGGAYVPLDPGYPEERLRFMLDDANIAVLLTQESLLGRTQNSTLSSPALCLDRDWPLIVQQRDDNPIQAINSGNLAYIIYTSGSTAKPKGVQIEHRSVVNCLHSLTDRLGFNERDVLLAVTTIAFDISVLELFLPLFIGGKVVVAGRDQAADGTALINILTNSRVTALQTTPSTWRLLVDAGWGGSTGFKILCGGEALSTDLAEALLTRGEVWNLYGPTESTIWSTVQKVEHGQGPVLIGRPLANTRIYILDSHLQPVPIGVHGNLYIGGDGLARGYRNNPDSTAERFIPDLFGDKANARLYQTGDRGRYRPDGTIEFLGRSDTQVKIRGHRIELGEIESTLRQHPKVKKSVIVSRERDSSGERN